MTKKQAEIALRKILAEPGMNLRLSGKSFVLCDQTTIHCYGSTLQLLIWAYERKRDGQTRPKTGDAITEVVK